MVRSKLQHCRRGTMISTTSFSSRISRNYGEDEEDEIQDTSRCIYISLNGVLSSLQIEYLLILEDRVTHLVEILVKATIPFDKIGYIQESSSNSNLCDVYLCKLRGVVLLRIKKPIKDCLYPSWIKIVASMETKNIITISGLNVSNYLVGNFDEDVGTIKKLKSSSFDEYPNELNNSLDQVSDLEIGNIIQGIPAAIMNYSEARSIRCVNFVSVTKAAISVSSLKCLEKLYPLLSIVLNEEILQTPSINEYVQVVRSDPFALRTENLYC